MPCPSEGEIVEFVARSISVASAAGLESHLADCDDCRRLTFALAAERDDEARSISATTRIGRFEVIAELGSGAMGCVYRAIDPELGRHVAIKIRHGNTGLDVEGDDRLRREAQALARLAHPNVVAVYETGRHERTTYVAMEYVDGVTLDRWVETTRSPAEVIEMLAGVARGLVAAHAVGLVHRDIKPRNILISAAGLAKLGDFGLVRLDAARLPVARASLTAVFDLMVTLSVTGSLLGTPAYMAPEQLRGEIATERSDQFSFCVTLFEALCGARPFAGITVEALVTAIARGPSQAALEPLPRRVRRVLARGLQLDPERRFSSMSALLEVLSPRSTRARWVAFGAAAGLTIAVTLTATRAPDPAQRCAERDAQAIRVFGLERQAAIAARFASQDARALVEGHAAGRLLEDYGRRWDAANTRSCRATGGQSSRLRDRQRGCLERRLQQADDLGLLFTMPAPGAALTDPARAVEALSDPETCTRAELTDHEPPPLALAPVIAELERRVDHMVNLERAGRAREASQQIDGIVAAARAVQYARLLARALLAQAAVYAGIERFAELEALLDEAAREASKARDDELVAEAWTVRVHVLHEHLGRIEDARRWMPVADAAVLRAGDPPERRALLHTYAGLLLMERGAYAQARQELATGLAMRERAQPSATLAIASAHNSLAVVLLRSGMRTEASAHFETALALVRKTHGNLHPEVIAALNNLGVLYGTADPRRAIAYLDEARALGTQLRGARSADVATSLNLLGIARFALGEYAVAVGLHRQAYEIERALLGPSHPKLAYALGNIGTALIALGDYPGAVKVYRECVAIFAAVRGPHDAMLALAHGGLGDALQWVNDPAGAIASYQTALAMYEGSDAADGEDAAVVRVDLGQLMAAAGATSAARIQFARAYQSLAAVTGENRGYALRALAGLVYCDAVDHRVDQRRLVKLEDEVTAEHDLAPDVTAFSAYARARSYAALGDRRHARALGEASRADFAKAKMTTRRDAVERWLRELR